jgi:hypothetical protein
VTDAGGSPGWDELEAEALALVAEAAQRTLVVRVLGSTGIRLHCAASADAMRREERPAKDIDVLTRSSDRGAVRRLLEARGYEVDRDLLVAMEGMRYAFRHPLRRIDIDVFVDRLEFCHTIEVGERLADHVTTIPLEDLLLQKLQIVEITPGDVADAAALLATHGIAEDDAGREEVDSTYVADLLARDWGFHHTATRNLDRIAAAVRGDEVPGLDRESRQVVADRVAALQDAIERRPKALAWKMRARVGERMQWWDDVHERRDTY